MIARHPELTGYVSQICVEARKFLSQVSFIFTSKGFFGKICHFGQ